MRIGDVARSSGVSARMLRHYESLGLVTPSDRTSAGYREYSAADLTRILHVEALRSLGLPLREIGQALDDPSFQFGEAMRRLSDQAHERIRREHLLLDRLAQIESADSHSVDDVLATLAALTALQSPSASTRHRTALTADPSSLPTAALAAAFLGEEDPAVAGALRWAVLRAGDEALPALTDGLADADPAVRRRAVDALAESAGETTAALTAALDDADPHVRAAAAVSLAERRSELAVDELVDMVVTGVRDVDAADALSLLDHHVAADRLAGAVDGAEAASRRRIAQALGELSTPAAARTLEQLADDPDQATALTAAFLLKRGGGRTGEPLAP